MSPTNTRTTGRPTAAAAVLALSLAAGLLPAVAGAVTPGEPAPDFTLTDTEGQTHALAALLEEGRIVVLEWFNPECPFILKHHQHHRTMEDLAARYRDQGVVWLAINSGAPGKQGAGLERNKKAREDFRMEIPVLLDEDGAVGKAFGAKTTPHMFVIGRDGKIAYAGAIDDDRSPGTLGKVNHVGATLDALLAGKAVPVAESQPYGCSVKYAS